jgi:hypothetical protein
MNVNKELTKYQKLVTKHTDCILRWGLAGSFLGHGFFALQQTTSMVSRVSNSPFMPNFITTSQFLTGLGTWDIALGLLFLTNWKTRMVSLLGACWITIVLINFVGLGQPIDAVERLGFLAAALVLFATTKKK